MKKVMMFTPLIAVAMMTSVPMSSLAENPAENHSTTATMKADETSQGYKDGAEAYKLDKLAGRTIGAKTSHLYEHPPVKKGADREKYLAQFEAGYNASQSQAN